MEATAITQPVIATEKNANGIKSSLTDFQRDALIASEKELEDLKAELEAKKYLVDISEKDVKIISDFIENDAPWKFTEALGIVEVKKETDKAIKTGKLFTSAIAIEAIYYYMSKIEGNGNFTSLKNKSIPDVTTFLRLLKAVTYSVDRIKEDNEKVRNLEFTVAARREGIEPDSSITT